MLEFAEDIEIDIPKFWDYMAQLLSHPVSDPSLIPLSLVTSLMPASLVENGKVGVLAAKVDFFFTVSLAGRALNLILYAFVTT